MARRGRKRKTGKRTDSGALQRPTTRRARQEAKHDPRKGGVEARQRVYALSDAQADRPEATDVIGRVFLTGALSAATDDIVREVESRRRLEAARLYEDAHHQYARSLDVKRIRSGSVINDAPQGGHDGSDPFADEIHEAWCAKAKANFMGARRALNQSGDYMAMMIVDAIVLEDAPMLDWAETLHVGLDALAEYYLLPKGVDTAA